LPIHIDKTQLLGGERGVLPEEVTILYKNGKITNLLKFKAIFWNSGNTPIRRQDIIEPMLLCLSTTSNLLKASVLKSSRPQNRVILVVVNDPQQMHVDFEYLEPRQGFNIELLVTGETTDDPVPTGIIIGMPREFVKFNEQKRRQIASAITLLILIIVGIVFVILTFLPSLKEINRSVVPGIWALSLILLTAFNLLWPQGISRQRIPRDLRT
jgi:hypothetical protein